MSSSVKSLSVGYNPINERNTFSSGDYIHGKITLELSKECSFQTLSIQMKGKAKVLWTENYGKTVVTYSSKNKYFSIKQILVQEGQGITTLNPGSHVFPFSFQIPAQELPSSFRGSYGKILYTLKANLSRSMRVDSKAKAEFNVINKLNLKSDPVLTTPQHNTIEKKMKILNSGAVGMDVNIERTGFLQGEGINVVASIQNKSTRDVKLKYSFYSKHSYFANGKRKVSTKEILKEVSLDVKYAADPEIKFPIIVLPAFVESYGEPSLPPAYGFDPTPNFSQYGGASFFDPPAYTPSAPPSAPPLHPPPLTFDSSGIYPPLTGWDKK
ncbi:arrestin domain-containing protein 3-like isoform X2 [Salarias fasciatus]|uniref:arrestin domain-containing protein 3-like isoform X2 n=1 Tax=Salarias fasciatus TaxID=181472 RepID=UPI001176F43A|nr:arrestin domain-containing protein 3-like isoform X2 [Salarias fasciatus]